jgi:hypothetical protein
MRLAVLALLPLCLGGCAGVVGNWIIGILAGIFAVVAVVFLGIALDDKRTMGCALLPGILSLALLVWLVSRLGVFAAIADALGPVGGFIFSISGFLFAVAIACFLVAGFGGFWLEGKKLLRLGLLGVGVVALVGGLAYRPVRQRMIEQDFPPTVRSRLASSRKVLTQLENRINELETALKEIRAAQLETENGERTQAKLQELEQRYETLLQEARAAHGELQDMKNAVYYEARFGRAEGIDESRVDRLSSKLEAADKFLQRSNEEIQETDF